MNQCQGCQANWPLVEVELFKGFKVTHHQVQGGYEGELCGCDAHLYEDKVKKPIDTPTQE